MIRRGPDGRPITAEEWKVKEASHAAELKRHQSEYRHWLAQEVAAAHPFATAGEIDTLVEVAIVEKRAATDRRIAERQERARKAAAPARSVQEVRQLREAAEDRAWGRQVADNVREDETSTAPDRRSPALLRALREAAHDRAADPKTILPPHDERRWYRFERLVRQAAQQRERRRQAAARRLGGHKVDRTPTEKKTLENIPPSLAISRASAKRLDAGSRLFSYVQPLAEHFASIIDGGTLWGELPIRSSRQGASR